MNIQEEMKAKINSRFATKTKPAQGKTNFMTKFLFISICVISTLILLVLPQKINFTFPLRRTSEKNDVVMNSPSNIPQPLPPKSSPLELRERELESRISLLEEKIERQHERIWLLAIANNENVCVSKDIDRNFHSIHNNDEYICFDKDWKLNHMPRRVDINEDGRRNIRENHLK